MYRVFIDDLEFYGFHGVPEQERAIGHRYCASIALEVDGKAIHSDRVEDTVDYGAVGKLVEMISASNQFRTVERLAQAIGEALLTEFRLAKTVNVRVEKLMPPAPMIAGSAGVEVELRR